MATVAGNIQAGILQRWRIALHSKKGFYPKPRAGLALEAYEQGQLENLIESALRHRTEELKRLEHAR